MSVSIPDIMALSEVRTANEAGRAALVLSPELDRVLFANGPAEALLAQAPGDGPPSFARTMERLRSIGPLLAEDGEAMLRLKSVGGEVEIWITAHVFLTAGPDGSPLALLTAPVPGRPTETAEALGARLLRETGLEGAVVLHAASFAEGDDPADAAGLTPAALADARDFLSGEDASGEGDHLRLWRVASGIAVAQRVEMAPQPEDDRPEGDPAEDGEIGLLIGRLRGRGTARLLEPAPDAPPATVAQTVRAEEEASRPAPAGRLGGDPVRFVWRVDSEARFSQLSPEFAEIVGPGAADVIGLAFADVAEAFGFDEAGEIGGLIERRDTFSGRSVLWPVEGTDRRVPVDLAALPVYARDRSFEGFRGFGMVRPDEHVEDPSAVGMLFGTGDPLAVTPGEATLADALDEFDELEEHVEDEPVRPFGRRADPPAPSSPPLRRDGASVVDLAEHRLREGVLSAAEEDAFRAIGQELSPPGGARARRQEDEGGIDALLRVMPLPVLIETRGRLVSANPAFFRFTGYESLDDFVAAGGLEALFADEPEDLEGDREAVRLSHADGRLLLSRVQMRKMTLDGRSSIVFSFVPSEAGGTVGVAPRPDPAALRLREEVEELRSVLDTATDGVLLLDPSGGIRSMNGSAEALLGLRPGTYAGRGFAEFLAPASRRSALDYLDSLRDGGLAGILNDGREVMAEVAERGVIPLFLTIGRLADDRGWCVVLRDIAHWKRVEEELVAARRQAEDASLTKSRFLANISHELRTPLNAIIGFADVMAAETYGPIGHERYLEYLRDIKRSGHHVLDLVNDLLDISKIEAGKVDLAFEAVSLNEVVAEVVSLMQPQANRERVIVRSTLPAGIPAVVADRRTLRQIALNLVANAVRFTPAGGQIIASTSYGDDGSVALRFRDTGIGMTDREVEIALTPFQQVNSAAKERGDGTGLGLPLTKAMVEANRAHFHIASEPGEGTLIEITFPAQHVLAH